MLAAAAVVVAGKQAAVTIGVGAAGRHGNQIQAGTEFLDGIIARRIAPLVHGVKAMSTHKTSVPNFRETLQDFAFPAGLGIPGAEILIDKALKRAGRANFSDLSFVRPLNLLLKAYAEEADLSIFGRYAVRYDLERCLTNQLRLDMAEEEDPGITARQIRSPVFITGMPRSATSFLHLVLSQDPANNVPRCWQLIYPYPSRHSFLPLDLRKTRVEMELRLFHRMAPGLDGLHHISADAPQECTDITAQVFQSIRFENTHRIPSYQAWIDRHGHYEAFLFHRRFLQHLDAQMPGRRWILKSPDHVFALDAIQAVYPDAKFVFLHRDPVSVVSSCAKLAEQLRRPFTNRLDKMEIGRQVSERLIQAAGHMVDAASRMPHILHLHYREVVANPMAAVRTLYRHCGLDLSDIAGRRMAAFLERPQPLSAQRYDFAEFGFDPGALRERFADYVRYFGVP
jgi:hypothetical protein